MKILEFIANASLILAFIFALLEKEYNACCMLALLYINFQLIEIKEKL